MKKNEKVAKAPKSRMELGFKVATEYYSEIFTINFKVLLYFIPTLIVWLSWQLYEVVVLGELVKDVTNESLLNLYRGADFLAYLCLLPCLMILFVGLAGGFNSMKLICLASGVDLKRDFRKGIKDNYKRFILCGFVFWIVIGSMFVSVELLKSSIVFVPVGIINLIVNAIIVCILVFVMTQSVLYDSKMTQTIKNAALFGVKEFIGNIVLAFFILFPIVNMMFFGLEMINAITVVSLLLVYIACIILISTIYSHHLFDKYFNEKEGTRLFDKWAE